MRRRPHSLRRLAAIPLALAVGLFGLGLGVDLLGPTRPTAGAGGLIGNPFAGPGERCGAITELYLPAGGWVGCTHGPDPAPDGVDIRRRFDSAKVPAGFLLPDENIDRRTASAGAGYERCFGDGRDGVRFQAIYARPAGLATDQFATIVPFIRKWAAEADAVFMGSATPSGGIRHIRWVHDAVCQPIVEHVVLSDAGDDTLGNTIAELHAMGYNDPNRKYVVWMDANEMCGEASYYEDDRPGVENFNNGNVLAPATVARIDNGCWGLAGQGESFEAHEMMHSLGSVMPTSPHATLLGHCTDDADRMCYKDGPLTIRVNVVCESTQEAFFDCRKDDYFNAAAVPVGYLADHWNTARSAFLATTDGDDPLSIVGGAIPEGDPLNPKQLTFTVSLAVPQNNTASVNWATADGTAVAGRDYEPAGGTLTFAPGETVKTITVKAIGDFEKEADEDFFVRLSDPVNGVLSDAPGRGVLINEDPKGQGYWLVASDGGIFAFADSGFHGSTGAIKLNQPIVGMTATPSGQGYWMVASDGGIFSFGDAAFHGSTGNIKLNQPIVGMAATPSGSGYWMVAADGGVFAFDAPSHGSAAGLSRSSAVAMAPTTSGNGYWVVTADGQIFNFGDAANFGKTPALSHPIVGAAATPSGAGLWLVARDGGIFGFGDAGFYGSTGAIRLNKPINGMAALPRPLG